MSALCFQNAVFLYAFLWTVLLAMMASCFSFFEEDTSVMLVRPITLEPLKMGGSCIEMSVIPKQLKEYIKPRVNSLWKSSCDSSDWCLVQLMPGQQPPSSAVRSRRLPLCPVSKVTHSDHAYVHGKWYSSQRSILRLGTHHELPCLGQIHLLLFFQCIYHCPMCIHCSTTRTCRKIVKSSILDRWVKLLSVCSRSMENTSHIWSKVKNIELIL